MDINTLSVDRNMSIREAIEKLDSSGKKILIVVNNRKVIGVITDGDIRRCILSSRSISEAVENIMTKSPIVLNVNNVSDASKLMIEKKIEAIPLINDKNELMDIIFWDDIYIEKVNYFESNNIPVVIMAGGEGRRLQPYTKIIPKVLIPIGDIPIVERIIGKFLEYKFNKFYLSINYKKDIIKAYFNKNLPYKISFIEEEKPLGTAGSLYLLKGIINETFFVSNCDILIETNYSDILKFHKKNKNKITIITALKDYVIPYGVFKLNEEGNIISLEEKPNYQLLVNTGMYVLEPEVLNSIKQNTYCDMTEIIEEYLAKGEKVDIYPVTDGAWLDMGEFDSMKNMIDKLNV